MKKRTTFPGDPDYISPSEKAELIDRARVARWKAPKRPNNSTITYPGFRGEPSALPGKRLA